jgi:hypothetical protein
MGRVAAGIFTLGLSEAFRSSKPKSEPAPKPQPLPAPPTVTQAGEEAEETKRRRKKAATKSIYTSPLGVGGEADVVRKSLLGR